MATSEVVGQKAAVVQGENVAALLKVGDRTMQAPWTGRSKVVVTTGVRALIPMPAQPPRHDQYPRVRPRPRDQQDSNVRAVAAVAA